MTTAAEIRKLEEEIIGLMLDGLIAAGYSLTVDYGEGDEFPPTQDKSKILEALWACHEERVYCYSPNESTLPNGGILLIYGEQGWDVICDNSCSLEPALAAASKRAMEMADAPGV